MFVPLGSSLTAFKNGKAFWRKNLVHFKGEVWNPEEIKITPKIIKQVYLNFGIHPICGGEISVWNRLQRIYANDIQVLKYIPAPRCMAAG